eukprot:CAMPEP_0202375868 /NCGR_PEP_ID=MMETSP1127-20130417/6472_1 /ASSEMBLY_ACC=CAM_ASM_000462 /TAXON_ID=3047 /ORGANISM="Dunaliella tertiolecta, Strain CCMP1320" /LENGTH=1054 /DNA_ID=CAMNT_0048973485 /DNA_START=2551 /DNA_END=5712 /DNA_ORIENTATION=+
MSAKQLSKSNSFAYYLSHDINLQVRVRICEFLGLLPSQKQQLQDVSGSRSTAVYVVASLTAGGNILGLETRTTYAESNACGSEWGEWLVFCVKYRDLPHDTQLSLLVWEMADTASQRLVGSTVMPLFSRKGRLKTGPQRLKVWEGVPPCLSWPTTTPAKLPLHKRGTLAELEHLLSLYDRGDMPTVEWLDPLVIQEIQKLQQQQQQQGAQQQAHQQQGHGQLDLQGQQDVQGPQLLITLPSFPQAVLYQQPASAAAVTQAGAAAAAAAASSGAPGGHTPASSGPLGFAARARFWATGGGGSAAEASAAAAAAASDGYGGDRPGGRIIVLHDPEVGRDNPAELKAQKLARSVTRGVIDRDLKPNGEERRRIAAILRQPPNRPLHAEERAILWRFRFSLQQETRALTKFLQCVDWGDATEGRQAAELMAGWVPIDTADALELLSPAFKNEEVRSHAVSVLQQKDDEELLSYLLQLVQALRYERDNVSRLSKFLVARALANPTFAITLHWYLFTEFEDAGFGGRASLIHAHLLQALQQQAAAARQASAAAEKARAAAAAAAAAPPHHIHHMTPHSSSAMPQQSQSQGTQGGQRPHLASPQPAAAAGVGMREPPPLTGTTIQGAKVFEAIRRQTDMLSQMQYLIKDLKGSRLRAARATARLQELVSEAGPCGELTVMRVPLPLDPGVLLDGIVPSECSCFKSAQLPLRLHFKVDPQPISWRLSSSKSSHTPLQPPPQSSQPPQPPAATSNTHPSSPPAGQQQPHQQGTGTQPTAAPAPPPTPKQIIAGLPSRTGIMLYHDAVRCALIYKKGDDLRQDQFILQMIGLMDKLLKRESLDLRLTPYKVLPTSSDDGLVEFVPSTPLSRVLSEHRTIHKYFSLTAAQPSGPFGLRPDVLETFVRSCAGYCVATYILGVGDRHLDNLMLCPDGRLFHIDFGYILGNDPKPFPPPMKICKEMVEAMGGQDSPWYGQFRMYACEAYNILRKSADLILSLFHLMAGASIEAIRADPEKAILKLQEKFRLDLDDEAAVQWMQALLNESATALMPQIVETTHRWAQYW